MNDNLKRQVYTWGHEPINAHRKWNEYTYSTNKLLTSTYKHAQEYFVELITMQRKINFRSRNEPELNSLRATLQKQVATTLELPN